MYSKTAIGVCASVAIAIIEWANEKVQSESKELSQSSAWHKEWQCRIIASYFGWV